MPFGGPPASLSGLAALVGARRVDIAVGKAVGGGVDDGDGVRVNVWVIEEVGVTGRVGVPVGDGDTVGGIVGSRVGIGVEKTFGVAGGGTGFNVSMRCWITVTLSVTASRRACSVVPARRAA